MKRTITIVFVSFVLTVLVLLTAWGGYQAVQVRRENLQRIGNRISLFNDGFSGVVLSEKGTATKELRKKAADLFGDEGRLQALVFYSKRDGIIFRTTLSDNKKIDAQINALPERLLPPAVKLNGFFHFSRTGEISDTEGNKIYVLYIFESLGRADVVYILTIALFVVIALAVMTLIMIIITSRMGADRPARQTSSSRGLYSAPSKAPPIKREIRRAPENESFDDDFSLDTDSPVSGIADEDFSPPDGDFSLPDEDFSLPGEDFSLPDSFDALDDKSEADDKALKELIPDIPEEEDLRAGEHERKEPESYVLEEDLELPTLEDFSADELEDFNPESDDFSLTEIDGEPSEKSMYSPKSGFCWESFLKERLKNELDRAISDNEDLLLMLFQETQPEAGDSVKELAELIREEYPHNDLNFEYTDSGYAVILQNSEMDAGIAQLEDLLKKWNDMKSLRTVRVGLSARCGRLVEADRLLTEAESSLSKASEENPIVGFRPDPEKFRQFISKNG